MQVISESRVELRRLFGPVGGGGEDVQPPAEKAPVETIVEELAEAWSQVQARHERPYVLANMISTADGRAAVKGRSGQIGNAADRELFHGLRSVVDAIMVGAGTARLERYGRIIKSERALSARRARGLHEEPLAVIVTGHPELLGVVPLLGAHGARVVIVTGSEGELPASAAEVSYIRAEPGGQIDLRAALRELAERFGVGTLLCEGGPHLVGELVQAGLLDELFLSLAPKLAGGEPADPDLRIVAATDFEPLIEMRLLDVFEQDSLLALRYGVG